MNGLTQPFQQLERVIGFFNTYRHQYPVSRDVLHEIADQFQNWVVNRSQKWGAPILEAPEERVVAIVKGREPARIMIAIAMEGLPALGPRRVNIDKYFFGVRLQGTKPPAV